MIKKILLLIINLIFLILIVNIAYAVDVGIVVEFEDGSVKTDCVNVNQNTDGFNILEKSVFNILWSPASSFGQLICKIEDEGTDISGSFCKFSGKFWNFNILPDGDSKWIHSPVGHNGPGGCWNRNELSFGGHYCGVDKDVIGYKFGSGGDEPPLKTYKQVCEKLKVKDIKVYVDGKKESDADEDGGKIDVVPGSKLELKIELENLYTDDEDVEIQDIVVEGTLENIDNDDDIEKDTKEFDLRPEKDKEVSLEFDIPLEVDEDDYDLIIEIEGENENGFSYFKQIEFEVEVEKEKHNVIFDQLKFSENSIHCGKSAYLEVKVVNLGTEDESAKLIISNQDLEINIQESFELSEDPFDKDSSFTKTYKIILPSEIYPGIYTLRADLFFGNDVESSTAELDVECGEILKTEEIKETVQTSKLIETNVVGATVSNPEKKLSNTDILMISTIAGEVIILISGITYLIVLLRR